MKKRFGFGYALVLACCLVSGCASTKGGGRKDRDAVREWQQSRVSAEPVRVTAAVPVVQSGITALAPVPAGIYGAVIPVVDRAAALDRGRRLYIGFVNDVKAGEAAGMARSEAVRQVRDALLGQPGGKEKWERIAEYAAALETSNLDIAKQTYAKLTKDVSDALLLVSGQMTELLGRLSREEEIGLAEIAIQSCRLKDDFGRMKAQLDDANTGLAIYRELIRSDEAAKGYLKDYPVETGKPSAAGK